jgi:hypothetical protein
MATTTAKRKEITIDEAIEVLQKWQHKKRFQRSLIVIYGEGGGAFCNFDTVNLLTEGDMASWKGLIRKAMRLHPDFCAANKEAVLGLTDPQLRKIQSALESIKKTI